MWALVVGGLLSLSLALGGFQGLGQDVWWQKVPVNELSREYRCGLSLLSASLPPGMEVDEQGELELARGALVVPAFDKTDIVTGRRITLDYLRGRVSFLFFLDIEFFDYVPWWPPLKLPPGVEFKPGYSAKRSLSHLQKLYEAFANAGVAVLGVLTGPFGEREDFRGEKRTRALAEELGLTFPLIEGHELFEALDIRTHSGVIVVVDREGKVRFKGELDDPIIYGLGLDCDRLSRFLLEKAQ